MSAKFEITTLKKQCPMSQQFHGSVDEISTKEYENVQNRWVEI